jgi:CRP/FNR family transcriptional regulator, cyclic AMP receptor protein
MALPANLRSCPLFLELFDREIEKIAIGADVITYERGDFLVRDGEEGDEIFVLLDGEVMVEKNLGKERISIQRLCAGDVFGELVLLDIRLRSADIVALKECQVLALKYDAIFSLFKKEPRIFGLLTLNMSRLLASRLRKANESISHLKKQTQQAA